MENRIKNMIIQIEGTFSEEFLRQSELAKIHRHQLIEQVIEMGNRITLANASITLPYNGIIYH